MNPATPLAERLRPKTLSDLVGQEHLSGENSVLQKSIQKRKVPSMILWGPPGVGKTTLANIIATNFNSAYFQLSAISSGVKELREVIEEAKNLGGAIVFIDEIHRFNKGQQDALLGAVEKGIITLIGAHGAYQMRDMNNKRSGCSVRQRPMQTLELEERVHTSRHRTVLTLTQYGHLRLVDDTSNHRLKFWNNPRQKI